MDSNNAAYAALDDMIEKCLALPNMAKENAPAVADLMRENIAQSIAASMTPEGEAWKPTADGHAPLQGAMGAITVEAIGTRVVATLTGHYIFHQQGRQSNKARKLEKAAGAARKAAAEAGGVAHKLEKKLARASASAGSRKTKKGKLKAQEKIARLTKEHADAAGKAGRRGTIAKLAGVAHAQQKGVGGLPARPMIPSRLVAKTGYALREFFKARFDARMSAS